MNKSIAIVGSGIAGLSLGYYLVRNGFKVTIFDTSDKPNASQCSQGVATIKGLKFSDRPLFHAKLEGHRFLLEMLEELKSFDNN